jgi:hypothetical protein
MAEPMAEALANPMGTPSGSQGQADTSAEGSLDRLGAQTSVDPLFAEPALANGSKEPTARGATTPMPMTKPKPKSDANQPDAPSGEPTGPSPKPPLVYLSGSLTSGLMAWLCLLFSQRVVIHFSLHPPHYSARIAQSIATALKTLIVGMGFLSTFSCAFVALGLFLVFIRSLSRAEAPGAS